MSQMRSSEASRHRFNQLVESGAYASGFQHAKPAQDLVESVVSKLIRDFASRGSAPSILDAGCGNGAWLYFLAMCAAKHDVHPQFYGFDVADRMVESARETLAPLDAEVRLQRGDVLETEAYRFNDDRATFDLVFAYDVVQQIAPRRQFEAVCRLADVVKPGGAAVVFDQERWSRFGLRMAFRKFVTANLGVPLVPQYFCAASYPALARTARRVAAASDMEAEVVAASQTPKRALVLRRAGIPA